MRHKDIMLRYIHCLSFLLGCCLNEEVEAVPPTFLVPVAGTPPRSVDENSRKDLSILTVEGQDSDGDNLTFSISTQDPMSPPFEIDSLSGLFKTPNGLDAETTTFFNFTFGVSDGTTTVDSVPFIVNINDLNDNTPQFTGAPYSASLLDSVGNGTSVVTVTATDADVTPATISYSITGGNNGSTFAIDGNGQITVAASSNLNGAATFTLVVQASDGSNTNTANVTITVNEDFCTPSPCQNSGTCALTGNTYSCSCPSGFIGQNCTEVDYCSGDPCVNGACINGNTNYTCNCTAGFMGTNCSIVDYCFGGPCVNGNCINGNTNYMCNCTDGYLGVNCSAVDFCATNPCQNGGTCTNGPTTHSCICDTGYTGPNCTETVNNCASNPCKNGGTCFNGLNFYNCTCPVGCSGTDCGECEECDGCCTTFCKDADSCGDCCAKCVAIPCISILSIGVIGGIAFYLLNNGNHTKNKFYSLCQWFVKDIKGNTVEPKKKMGKNEGTASEMRVQTRSMSPSGPNSSGINRSSRNQPPHRLIPIVR